MLHFLRVFSMCLKMILSFLLGMCMFSSPMIGPRKNKLRSYSTGQPVFEPDEKPFDFMSYFLKKFTQEITKCDGTQETIQLKSPPITMRSDHCYSTLHEAAIANDEKGIEKLLQLDEHKMQLNGFDLDGQTPLQCAIDYSADKAIICLIMHGAQADVKNQAGEYTAWTLAKAYFDSKIGASVLPFMTLQHALMLKGCTTKSLSEYKKNYAKKKKTVEETKTVKMPEQNKPSRKIFLKRRTQKPPVPEYAPVPDDQDDDPYLLNV
jgi:hypothetical protein